MKVSIDSLAEIARYYDDLMSHVNYDRWFTVAVEIAALLPRGFCHLDAACGTCALLRKLRGLGWRSMGLDLSLAMLREGFRHAPAPTVFVADLRAVPVVSQFHYITCLFDSINFLTETADLRLAFRELARALRPDGILYFDVVTERMILDHFAGRRWTERSGKLTTTWESKFCRESGIIETRISVKNGPESVVRERVYPLSVIAEAVEAAGLHVVQAVDAETWQPIRRKTTRIDYVAVKGNPELFRERLAAKAERIRDLMQ
ncbi:MAG TPA: class I SAM-dependent methyltransferase [Candidatus Hydrogenedentes bacterium]|nr:class I SAM-dependent methyltransferase [Candidatus Hydrogenedentota bacterium]HOL76409.1 class I SAM-dependent methyltransferase [Candidatus Hydrogenedentota bacterium]HPO85447.1 class I SAM-dependent methyltransferase [Candidatus Hydrogenedentota bacterium]